MKQLGILHGLGSTQQDVVIAVVALSGAILAGLLLYRVVFAVLARLASHREQVFGAIIRRTSRPAAYIFPLLAVLAIFPNLSLPHAWVERVERIGTIAIVAAVASALVALIMLGADYVKAAQGAETSDTVRYRRIATRVDILSRVAATIVIIVATAACLMTIPAVRAIGATLLASAGVAGLAVGLATRPVLENLVAGIQIALTQPVRIDDIVVVESQQGRVEEITATYVVVALWDRRRMILPLTYFIDKPFENLTRNGSALTGAVLLYTDYSMVVDDLRSEVDRILGGSELWDGTVKSVHVMEADAQGMQIRIAVSARSPAALFDLRALVREQLIAFMQERHPGALPATRLVGVSNVPFINRSANAAPAGNSRT